MTLKSEVSAGHEMYLSIGQVGMPWLQQEWTKGRQIPRPNRAEHPKLQLHFFVPFNFGCLLLYTEAEREKKRIGIIMMMLSAKEINLSLPWVYYSHYSNSFPNEKVSVSSSTF